MAKNPLTINPLDEDKFSLEFSRDSLTEFVFSLLATPRQERRTYETGFDLRLDDTKSILDKIAHKIQTDHDILHNDFTADVVFKGGTRLTFNSYEQFFSTSDVRNDEIEQLSITLSVVIPFNRSVDEKSFEKQTIFILVKAGQVGRVEVDIRSTEITWPAGYFVLVEQHFQKLSRAVRPVERPFIAKLLFLHPLFISDFIENTDKKRNTSLLNPERTRLAALTIMSVLVFFMIPLIASIPSISSEAQVFNPDLLKIEDADIFLLINEFGWEKAASLVRDSQTISRLNGIDYVDGSAPKTPASFFRDFFTSKTFIGLFSALFLIVLANVSYARMVAADRAGRIFLYNENLPPRTKGNLAWGVFGSLIIGAVGSALASGTLAMLGYF